MDSFINNKARKEIFTLKPYVPGKPIEEVKRELGLEDIIKIASNENPLGPSPKAMEAVEELIRDLHYYPDANCFNLKQKLAASTAVEPEGIVVGNGSDELLMVLAQAFLSPGDEVIYASPTFSEYEFVTRVMGGKCVEVPLHNFKHNLNAMLQAVNPNTKFIVLCNPNNPTGTFLSDKDIAGFMDSVPEDVLVVFDEAYSEYAGSPEFGSGLKYVQQGRNAIVLHTFSKIYGLAGLRVGYGLTRPAIARAMEMVMAPFNVNSAAQVAAQAALDDNEHLQRSQTVNSLGKKYLYGEFKRMGLNYVETQANFIFVDTGRDCQEVFKELLKCGVIIRTGDVFNFPTFIRVTVGTQNENERFIHNLEKILGVKEN
ncbi:MAG: histidinol-phosphate transaminase [Syntrophomonas sp.]